MLVKKALSLKDPNRDSNQKHITVNEIMDNTRKSKEKKYRVSTGKCVMKYQDGQYEKIFGKK